MPRRRKRFQGLGAIRPLKKANVDVVSSPLMVVETPDAPVILGSNKTYKERRALIASYYDVILNTGM